MRQAEAIVKGPQNRGYEIKRVSSQMAAARFTLNVDQKRSNQAPFGPSSHRRLQGLGRAQRPPAQRGAQWPAVHTRFKKKDYPQHSGHLTIAVPSLRPRRGAECPQGAQTGVGKKAARPMVRSDCADAMWLTVGTGIPEGVTCGTL